MDITIIGAGMAGLLAGRILKQHGHNPVLLEKQESLPNNHNSLLRFRSNIISDVTGIPFKKVQMIKATVPYLNPVAEALSYARKCFGSYRTDRSITQGITVAERYIAPPDFINQLAEGLDIHYNSSQHTCGGSPIISTIPMPSLFKLLGYMAGGDPVETFSWVDSYVLKAKMIKCSSYATLYFPDPAIPFYRASITDDQLICELVDYSNHDLSMEEAGIKERLDIIDLALFYFGISKHDLNSHSVPEIKKQKYAKILPIDDGARKRFMAWATDNHNVYSLGRFATWRPGLLLDDLVNDIKMIEKWIISGNNYDVRRIR